MHFATPPAPVPPARSPWQFCVAPMLDWTDRHCRYFHRLLTPHARLYTEMVTSAALIRGRQFKLLAYRPQEHPLALQLGGSDPAELAAAARLGEKAGFDEINLNVGCPSDRVQSGRFGACLMREPALVGDCAAAMQAAVRLPVTVKCRIGVDHQDAYADLQRFTEIVAATGIQALIVHARKAWLQGLSPKENRDIPPLDYPRVHLLKQAFPALTIVINGGINDVESALQHLTQVDGVMLGRVAYHDPYLLARLEHRLYGTPLPKRAAVLETMHDYVDAELKHGGSLQSMTRHVLGLYQGLPGARRFRRLLSEQAHHPEMTGQLLLQAQPARLASPDPAF